MVERFEMVCKYCGQTVIVTKEGERAEDHCLCPMAMLERSREENTEKLMESVRTLFGEECSEKTDDFMPVEEEVYTMLMEITDLVGHERIGAVSFALKDGSSGKISVKGVERKKSIVRKIG